MEEVVVEQICWSVGYDDPASFRRPFERITAVTPGSYRRMLVQHRPGTT